MNAAERRKTGRKRVFWPVVVLDGDRRIAASIVDLSRGGARLMFADRLPIQPDVFVIGDNFGPFECSVVWCKGGLAGIRFADPDAVKWVMSAPTARAVAFGRRQ